MRDRVKVKIITFNTNYVKSQNREFKTARF